MATFYRTKKYGGVPKMTNMRYGFTCLYRIFGNFEHYIFILFMREKTVDFPESPKPVLMCGWNFFLTLALRWKIMGQTEK